MSIFDKTKVLGIVSCKGGVGKSTMALNISLTIGNFFNKKVGLFDADIYGPNHHKLLGIHKKKKFDDFDSLVPESVYNIMSMSMGYFIDDDSAVLLRGPMVSNTMFYLLNNTKWGDLDYIVIDFPPGTGDVYLNLLKNIKFNGTFLITTPHDISVQNMKKSLLMLKKFDIPIFGIIENMKYYKCDNCSYIKKIDFGNDLCYLKNKFNIPYLYEFPFSDKLFKSIPIVVSDPNDSISYKYIDIVNNFIFL